MYTYVLCVSMYVLVMYAFMYYVCMYMYVLCVYVLGMYASMYVCMYYVCVCMYECVLFEGSKRTEGNTHVRLSRLSSKKQV